MLRDILRRLRTVDQLSDLFQALGFTPARDPHAHGGTVIGRWGNYEVVADASDDPTARARAMAGVFSRRSRRALAVVLGPTGHLAIAAPRIGTPGSTRALVVSV